MSDELLTRQQYELAQTLDRYENCKDTFFDGNPDLDQPELRDLMDSSARRVAGEEIQKFGRIISSPREVAKKAAEKVRTFAGKLQPVKATEETAPENVGTESAPDNSEVQKSHQDRVSQFRERQRKMMRGY